MLVEIAIVNLTPPSDTDRVPAHQAVDRRGIEGVNENLHVIVVLPVMPQVGRKPGDGQIGDGKETVEFDPKGATEFPLVVRLEARLVPGKEGPIGVVNEVQRQARVLPISK